MSSNPTPPMACSEPAYMYWKETKRLMNFLKVVIHNASLVGEAFQNLGSQGIVSSPVILVAAAEISARKGMLTPYEGLLFEMALCRSVDNYLNYLSELLALIFKTRPQALKASQQSVPLETILAHSDYGELLGAITEERVIGLSMKGLGDLNAYLEKQLGFPLFDDPDELAFCVLTVEKRNLIVHNRGVINRRYLRNVQRSSGALGERIILDGDSLIQDMGKLAVAALTTDPRVAAKFGIPQPQSVIVTDLMDATPY